MSWQWCSVIFLRSWSSWRFWRSGPCGGCPCGSCLSAATGAHSLWLWFFGWSWKRRIRSVTHQNLKSGSTEQKRLFPKAKLSTGKHVHHMDRSSLHATLCTKLSLDQIMCRLCKSPAGKTPLCVWMQKGLQPKMKGANWLKLMRYQGRSLVNIFSLWNIWYKSVVFL